MQEAHRHQFRLLLLAASLVFAVAAFPLAHVRAAGKSSSPMPGKNEAAGHLVVKRSANLGETLVALSVDGREVGRISFNGSYDAPISAGAHTLSALPFPNREHATASVIRLNVQPGKTYTFTAFRDDVRIALR